MSLHKYTIDAGWLVMPSGSAIEAQGREVCLHAQADAEIARYKRAVEWCLENGAIRSASGIVADGSITGEYSAAEIPADLRDIITGENP